jgi:hypothetical protein
MLEPFGSHDRKATFTKCCNVNDADSLPRKSAPAGASRSKSVAILKPSPECYRILLIRFGVSIPIMGGLAGYPRQLVPRFMEYAAGKETFALTFQVAVVS